jgi:hypothetical protein
MNKHGKNQTPEPTPVLVPQRRKRFAEALNMVNRRYHRALKKLAK